MKIFISKQLNKYLAEGFPMLDTDYGKHVLPEPDAMRDFKKQSGWVGKDGSGYPMFPHMTKDEYEHMAYDLRDDNSITALIHYNPNGKPGRKARASKHRILDLPPTRFNDKFAEIVFYSITDNDVVAYYLVTYPTRLDQLMLDTVYDIEGNVVDDHDELRNILKDDEYTSNQIRNFVTKSQVGEERQVESFSQITQLTDRMSSVIGYIKTDPKTGEQMLTDRFGSVKGWYKPKYDMTFDRYSRVLGRGNLLSTLLNKASFREALERTDLRDKAKEGIAYKNGNFEIDFNSDNIDDIISLVSPVLYRSNIGDNIYWFGYKFNDKVGRQTRKNFISWIKGLADQHPTEKQYEKIIARPISELYKATDTSKINLVVYPRSERSILVNRIVKVFGNLLPHSIPKSSVELVKNASKNVGFDWDTFNIEFDGTDKQYEDIKNYIENDLMPKIHNKDYFSIATEVKTKYRPYIKDYLIADSYTQNQIQNVGDGTILIVDDISTSNATINEMLKVIKSINPYCSIYIFTLIGKE